VLPTFNIKEVKKWENIGRAIGDLMWDKLNKESLTRNIFDITPIPYNSVRYITDEE